MRTMTDSPYEPAGTSRSKPGSIVDAPSDGEAFGCKLNDEDGDFYGYLIEWHHNPDAWISGDNNVSLNNRE